MKREKIAIIGLGYVGLPLAIEVARYFPVIGFDNNVKRIRNLSNGIDNTLDADTDGLNKVLLKKSSELKYKGLFFSSDQNELRRANIFIVTVPTPIDKFNSPDLSFLLNASKTIGKVIKKNDIVIYESTVYPGCTEEDCIPVLETVSGLKFNKDFFVGYSPERINPGDKINTLTKIKKVTSGSTPEIAEKINSLYKTIITAGTYKAQSIKVAEASKAVENAQRDLNISFVNELSLIFDRIGIDTNDVLDAAATKWNFLKFKPGFVGGHCISVDPYYLAYKSISLGYHPQVILSGRRVNDFMAQFVVNKMVKLMIKKGHKINNSNVLILGITFKENCSDIRNSKIIDVYKELKQFGLNVHVYDPLVNYEEVRKEYGIEILKSLSSDTYYSAIILAVPHNEFLKLDFEKYKKENTVIFDAKASLNKSLVDARL